MIAHASGRAAVSKPEDASSNPAHGSQLNTIKKFIKLADSTPIFTELRHTTAASFPAYHEKKNSRPGPFYMISQSSKNPSFPTPNQVFSQPENRLFSVQSGNRNCDICWSQKWPQVSEVLT